LYERLMELCCYLSWAIQNLQIQTRQKDNSIAKIVGCGAQTPFACLMLLALVLNGLNHGLCSIQHLAHRIATNGIAARRTQQLSSLMMSQ
jgi:hypothetical protein